MTESRSTTIVIVGTSGDLTQRKLVLALNLANELLVQDGRVWRLGCSHD